jgi:hypothetical protein
MASRALQLSRTSRTGCPQSSAPGATTCASVGLGRASQRATQKTVPSTIKALRHRRAWASEVGGAAGNLTFSWSGSDQTLSIHLEIPGIPCSAHLLYFPPTAQEDKVRAYAQLLRKQAVPSGRPRLAGGRPLNLICPADLCDPSRFTRRTGIRTPFARSFPTAGSPWAIPPCGIATTVAQTLPSALILAPMPPWGRGGGEEVPVREWTGYYATTPKQA